ncbi:DNA-binding protein [Bdellovibrio sp. qaytius]|nr:DNA-binding protein [Bdellovibrio sp. qaytius]
MSSDPEAWDKGVYEYPLDRFLEGTDEKIRAKYKDLNLVNLEALKQLPTLFTVEGEQKESRIGYIENIKVRSKALYIEFAFDPILPLIPQGALKQLDKPFDIGRWGLNRTRWMIKEADLFFELVKANFLIQKQVDAALFFRKHNSHGANRQNNIDVLNNDHVFIVHGHDDEAKVEAVSFVKSVGLTPIILHEQASQGKTIIEKIEAYTNVGFAIVLYTPCDLGSAKNVAYKGFNPRARQNVVLEHGYLMAKLGRSKVAALVKGSIETPNDISGVVYINFDSQGNWKNELRRELSVAGAPIV